MYDNSCKLHKSKSNHYTHTHNSHTYRSASINYQISEYLVNSTVTLIFAFICLYNNNNNFYDNSNNNNNNSIGDNALNIATHTKVIETHLICTTSFYWIDFRNQYFASLFLLLCLLFLLLLLLLLLVTDKHLINFAWFLIYLLIYGMALLHLYMYTRFINVYFIYIYIAFAFDFHNAFCGMLFIAFLVAS